MHEAVIVPAGVGVAHTRLRGGVIVQDGEGRIVARPSLAELRDVHGVAPR